MQVNDMLMNFVTKGMLATCYTHCYIYACYYIFNTVRWWLQNVPGISLFLIIQNRKKNLSYISFKIVPLCNHTLLPETVKVLETPLCESLFSSFVAFLMMSVASQKRCPFNADFSRQNR